MREEEINFVINFCPFRVTTINYPPPVFKGEREVTKSYFNACLKEKCPAFYVSHGEHGQEYERCKRLK